MGLLERINNAITKSSFGEHMKRLLPKYKGYYQQEDRRETDLLVRSKMTELLDRTESSLIDIMSILMDNGEVKLSKISKNLQDEVHLFRDQIKNAEYGFDVKSRFVTKEKTSTYDKILKADASLVIACTELFEHCTELQNRAFNGELNHSDFLEVRKVIQGAKKLFSNRRDFVTGVSDVLDVKSFN